MSRLRIGLACVTVLIGSAFIPVVLTGGVATAAPFPGGPITTACTGNSIGSTFTLTANCGPTTAPITVPDGFTVDGGGFTISAEDPSGGQFNGGVLTNAVGGTSMFIKNITVTGPVDGFNTCHQANFPLYGIYFNDASGSVSGVTVAHIWQIPDPNTQSCNTGTAIRAEGPTAGRTVTITNTTVEDFQKNGIDGRGLMTMDVSGSTMGAPHPLEGFIAPNGLVYVSGASGTATNNTIFGSGDQAPGHGGGGAGGSTDATAVLLFGAKNVTVTHNVITGAKTDIGIAVTSDSTGNVVSFNQIGRTAADVPDPTGIGVEVDPGSTATLTCNTFTGWNTDVVGAVEQPCPQGYWLVAADGGVFTFGAANFDGSGANIRLTAPVIGVASAPAGGYWLVASDGGDFSYGPTFFGSLGDQHLDAPIVGMAATPDGAGYYLAGADGGVFTFGDAHFQGSMAGKHLNKPIVGIAVTPDGQGYLLVASDGGVFTFGDAHFQGSMGGKPLNQRVVGVTVDIATSGYWLVAADGGVFTFGSPFLGSTGDVHLNAPVVGMAATTDAMGYRLVGADGGVFCFGSAQFFGSMAGIHLNQPVVGVAATG
jgi:hypothetical protein